MTAAVPAAPRPLSGHRRDQPRLRAPHRGLRYELNVRLPELCGVWPLERDHPRDVGGAVQFLRGRYGADADVVQQYFYLGHYVGGPLPGEALEQVRTGLAQLRAGGFSVVLRFAYDHSFLPRRPYTLEDVLTHIHQLGPIVSEFADIVTVWQAGFLGLWGEWGASIHPLSTDPEVATAVLTALLAELPDDLHTQVRYHAKSRLVTDASVRARIGFHNDYFTLSDDGMDLFRPEEEGWPDYVAASGTMPMDVELPWDGEQGVDDYPWDEPLDPVAAARRLQTLRTDTLGIVHNAHVTLAAWRRTPVTSAELGAAGLGVASDWFRDGDDLPGVRTWFEYLRDHLGYRLEGRWWSAAVAGGSLTVRLELRNVGFSAPLRPWVVSFVLLGADGAAVAEQRVDTDPRTWGPGGRAEDAPSAPAPVLLSAEFDTAALPDLAGLRLGVRLRDPHGEGPTPVPLANAETTLLGDVNVLGAITGE